MKICTLMSGSSGNAIYLETKKTKILLDAGQTGKKVTSYLKEATGRTPSELNAILLSHSHRDHYLGAGVLSRRYQLPIYATEGTWFETKNLLGELPSGCEHSIEPGKSWEFEDLKIETFPTSHDALDSVGFIFTEKGKSIGVATDSGVFTTRMEQKLKNMECLILEANHDPDLLQKGPYPWSVKKRIASILGHLSNEGAGQALLKVLGNKTNQVILAHLSQENNKPSLAIDTVKNMLTNNQVAIEELDIFVAPRYQPSPIFNV